MGIGERLKTIRNRKKLSQSQLAKRCRISKGYLSQLENEQFNNPTSEIVIKLSRALNVSVDAILGIKDLPTITSNYSAVPVSLRTLAQEQNLTDVDITMLSQISYGGRKPTSIEGWRAILQAIQNSTEGE